MKKLTTKEVERCATAYGWKKIAWDSHGIRYTNWEMKVTHGQIPVHLTHDPRFWFPRLWEAEKARHGDPDNPVLFYCTWLTDLAADCMRLCEALEVDDG